MSSLAPNESSCTVLRALNGSYRYPRRENPSIAPSGGYTVEHCHGRGRAMLCTRLSCAVPGLHLLRNMCQQWTGLDPEAYADLERLYQTLGRPTLQGQHMLHR